MNPKITIDNLILEITRKCNMKCRHCLRGNCQNKNITKELMEKVLSQINSIHCVVFGGGEPTLNLDAISDFIEIANLYNVEVGNFYIVTNAKVFKQRLINLCEELWNFCFDNEISGLAISDDLFHREWRNEEKFKLNKSRYLYDEEYDEPRPYVCFHKEVSDSTAYEGLIKMGRADENCIANRNKSVYLPYVDQQEFKDETYMNVLDGDLYISYDGRIFPDCDLSYKIIDSNKFLLGNINNESLLEIIKRLPKEHEERRNLNV